MVAYTTLLEILGCGSITVHFSQYIIFGYLRVHVSHTLGGPTVAQRNLCIRIVSPDNSVLAYTKYGSK